MKLPHVTIEYREEESYAVGKMSFELIVGFGLHWAWMFLFMYNGHNLFRTGDETYANTFFVASLAVFSCALIAYAAFLKRVRVVFGTPHKRRRNRAVGATCMFVGMVILVFVSGSDSVSTALSMASGALTGFGSAIILMSFGVSFSVLDVATSSICAALSLVVASCVYAFAMLLQTVASPVGAIVCLVLPFGELFCLSRCSRQLVDNLEFTMSTIPVHNIPFGFRLGLPFLVMGFAMGFVRGEAFSAAGAGAATSDVTMSILLAGTFACALIMAAMLAQRKTSYYAFRTLFPVVAVLLGFSVSPLGQNPAFSVFSLISSYLLMETCMWIALADISQRFRISSFTVFGIGRGMMAIGLLSAVLVGNPFPDESSLGAEATLPVVLILILLMAVHSFIPTNTELRSTLAYGNACPAFLDRDDLADPNASGAATGERPSKPPFVLLNELPEQTGRTDTAAQDRTSAQAEEPARNEAPHSEDPPTPERLGRFKRKCLFVADTYLLSRKETEVLFLLAKGHNSSAIQKTLYISAGTANTHMRNIYRKLGVHSQQELISMVESTEEKPS